MQKTPNDQRADEETAEKQTSKIPFLQQTDSDVIIHSFFNTFDYIVSNVIFN